MCVLQDAKLHNSGVLPELKLKCLITSADLWNMNGKGLYFFDLPKKKGGMPLDHVKSSYAPGQKGAWGWGLQLTCVLQQSLWRVGTIDDVHQRAKHHGHWGLHVSPCSQYQANT